MAIRIVGAGGALEDSTRTRIQPMYSGMSKPGHSRQIKVHVPWWEFAPGVWTALERLGYELVPVRRSAEAPGARIVAADRLSQLSTEATVPIILIGEPQSQGGDGSRVIGVVRPPAELLDLYPLLQSALEEHPRAAPRTPTSLLARSFREGVDTPGTILSLSERGCLMRTEMSLPGAGSLHLQFRLPYLGLIQTPAEPRHETGNEFGLAFQRLPEASRTAIAKFVTRSLVHGF
jgi:hypothetical protein